jgi:transposase
MKSKTMSKQTKKTRRSRRTFTPEYKAEVVRLATLPGKTPHSVARELDLPPTAVRQWVLQAEVDANGGGTGALTTAEREELAALRRENRSLRQERDILRKATALFAREGMS